MLVTYLFGFTLSLWVGLQFTEFAVGRYFQLTCVLSVGAQNTMIDPNGTDQLGMGLHPQPLTQDPVSAQRLLSLLNWLYICLSRSMDLLQGAAGPHCSSLSSCCRCLEGLWSLYPWRQSNLITHRHCALTFLALSQGLGCNNLQRSLPTSAILWLVFANTPRPSILIRVEMTVVLPPFCIL